MDGLCNMDAQLSMFRDNHDALDAVSEKGNHELLNCKIPVGRVHEPSSVLRFTS